MAFQLGSVRLQTDTFPLNSARNYSAHSFARMLPELEHQLSAK
jgi:hypothetical protein